MRSSFLALCATALVFGPCLRAAEPAIVTKARAYLGSESALQGLISVHLVGELTKEDPANPKSVASAHIDIVFQKPYQESITITSTERFIRTALDDFEAWQQIQLSVPAQTAIDPSRNSQLTLLGSDQVKILRADTLENLFFYRGVDQAGGSTQDLGPATVDGLACEKVSFVYSPTVTYVRYFDLATGRLVFSQTLGGAAIREHGDMIVSGIRFPKTITTVDKDATGKPMQSTYTFDVITLNESFPESLFAVPLLQPVRQPLPR